MISSFVIRYLLITYPIEMNNLDIADRDLLSLGMLRVATGRVGSGTSKFSTGRVGSGQQI